jgi:hypothetical protein
MSLTLIVTSAVTGLVGLAMWLFVRAQTKIAVVEEQKKQLEKKSEILNEQNKILAIKRDTSKQLREGKF